jgi:hypothetical protein
MHFSDGLWDRVLCSKLRVEHEERAVAFIRLAISPIGESGGEGSELRCGRSTNLNIRLNIVDSEEANINVPPILRKVAVIR